MSDTNNPPWFGEVSTQVSTALSASALTVSIFADNVLTRCQLLEDSDLFGLRIIKATTITEFALENLEPWDDIMLIDCPHVEAGVLSALEQISKFEANASTLVVSTSPEGLEEIFGCIDCSRTQILVAPSRAERLIALWRAVSSRTTFELRELSSDDRFVMLRLTEQLSLLAKRIEQLDGNSHENIQLPFSSDRSSVYHDPAKPGQNRPIGAFHFSSSAGRQQPTVDRSEDGLIMDPIQKFPDSKFIRRILRQRQLRAQFFDADLFADPAWDMLLDLTAARAEQSRVSVTSLCIASGVPPTTALRWIGQMTEAGLLQRNEDTTDRRRAFIALTEKAADAIARFFVQLDRTCPIV